MDRIRALQDETHGFMSFIPLAYQPDNNPLAAELEALGKRVHTTGLDDLRNLAVARIYLDNVPHIKGYWIMITPEQTQLSLAAGVSDVDGTIKDERIAHASGAVTEAGMTEAELVRLIKDAGRVPVRRDALYARAQGVLLTMPDTTVGRAAAAARAHEVLGIVSYTNVAPLHWGLEPWPGARFVRGVPTELNAALLRGDVDLTLVSSVEFIRHRRASSRCRTSRSPRWDPCTASRSSTGDRGPTCAARASRCHHPLRHQRRAAARAAGDLGIEAELTPVEPDLEAMLGALRRRPADRRQRARSRRSRAGRSVAGPAADGPRRGVVRRDAPAVHLRRLGRARRAAAEPAPGGRAARRRASAASGTSPTVARGRGASAAALRAHVLRYLSNFRYFLEPPDRDGCWRSRARGPGPRLESCASSRCDFDER
jgi:hypothetical protein